MKGDHVLSISNLKTIKEFKELYIEKLGDKSLKIDKIRMFCLGKEFKDELYLYTYDLQDEIIVQAMFKK